MPAAKEKRSAYTFDDKLAQELKDRVDNNISIPLKPREIGYRLLPDYYGSDVIDVLVILPKSFKVDDMSYDDTVLLKKTIRTWTARKFPSFTNMFSFDQ